MPAYRTLWIGCDFECQKNMEKNQKYDYEKLNKINHVVEVYNSQYSYYGASTTSFKSEKLSGEIEFLYGTKNVLPSNIIGQRISGDDTGVAICPIDFYPSNIATSTIVHKKEFLNGHDLLNHEFTVTYEKVERDLNNKEYIEQKITKKFKIVGLYNHQDLYNRPNNCYISKKDIIEMNDASFKEYNKDVEKAWLVVVDKKENVDYVINELKKQKLTVEMGAFSDDSYVKIVAVVCDFIVGIALIVVVILSYAYIKKQIINSTYELGMLKAIGFTTVDIKKTKTLEIFILLLVSFLIGIALTNAILLFIKYKFAGFLLANCLTINITIKNYFVAILAIFIFPVLINISVIHKKMKTSTINLLKGENI